MEEMERLAAPGERDMESRKESSILSSGSVFMSQPNSIRPQTQHLLVKTRVRITDLGNIVQQININLDLM